MIEVNDIDTIVSKLDGVQRQFGFFGVLLVIALSIVIILSFVYFKKLIEKAAEESSEKSLKKFQSQLDKELVKFSSKHQKQLDAIHETFQKLQKMTSLINFLLKGDNYTQPLSSKDSINYLIEFRHNFKKTYNENRLLFSSDLCKKIDTLFPSIDKFIEIYGGGLLPRENREEEPNEENSGLFLAGIWSVEAFDETLLQLDTISKEIETEFRTIYGIEE